MSTFTNIPDFGAKETKKSATIKTQFGDGYSQRQSIGMNPLSSEWDLTFSNRSSTEAATINAFLVALAGATSFDWTPPNGSATKWTCETWDIKTVRYNLYTINAKFIQVYEP